MAVPNNESARLLLAPGGPVALSSDDDDSWEEYTDEEPTEEARGLSIQEHEMPKLPEEEEAVRRPLIRKRRRRRKKAEAPVPPLLLPLAVEKVEKTRDSPPRRKSILKPGPDEVDPNDDDAYERRRSIRWADEAPTIAPGSPGPVLVQPLYVEHQVPYWNRRSPYLAEPRMMGYMAFWRQIKGKPLIILAFLGGAILLGLFIAFLFYKRLGWSF